MIPPADVAINPTPNEARADGIRVLTRVGERRHAAHRVSDQNERPDRYDSADHVGQVLAELIDGAAVGRCGTGFAVAAVVVQNDSRVLAPDILDVGAQLGPRLHPQAVSMDEHHGQSRIGPSELAHCERGSVPCGDGAPATDQVVLLTRTHVRSAVSGSRDATWMLSGTSLVRHAVLPESHSSRLW